jgi:transposase
MTDAPEEFILGIDTHKQFHHAALITTFGRDVADGRFDATSAGYDRLIAWATGHGRVVQAAIEGTGSYGAAIAHRLRQLGVTVIDVNTPDRQDRRRRGKSDRFDAYSAARAVLSGRATTVVKDHDGEVEAARLLRTTRQLLIKQRTETINQLHSILVSAPEAVRAALTGATGKRLAKACARLRDRTADDLVTATVKDMLRSLGRRYLHLDEEAIRIKRTLTQVVTAYAPELILVEGVGPDVAAALLTATGQNMNRLRSEAALAHLAGAAPIPASSGKTIRHRLNRGGNRQANAALYRIALVRMRSHQPTRDYVAKCLARGKSKQDAIRLLKRYIARQIYTVLTTIDHRHHATSTA